MFENLDLSKMPNRQANYNRDKYNIALPQEKYVRDQLNNIEVNSNHIWMLTEEFTGDIDKKHNLILGDIICIDKYTGKAIMFIDLKVQEYNSKYPNLVGTITVNSLLQFASITANNKFYICTNYNGTNIIVIDAKQFKEAVLSGKYNYLTNSYSRKHFYNQCYYQLWNDINKLSYCYYNEKYRNPEQISQEDYFKSFGYNKFNLKK